MPERELLPRLVSEPGGATPKGSVIWLHGLGDSGHGFAPILPALPLDQLGVRVVLPHAPKQPVTINGGFVMPAWYDIRPTDGPDRHDEAGIRRSAEAVDALLAREVEELGADRVALVGFSQGGAMALHCGLRAKATLAGIAALSTYLLLPDATTAERTDARPPVLQAHGRFDDVVAPGRGEAAREWLQEHGYAVEWHDYGMGHEVCQEEIDHLASWFERIFS